MIFVNFKTYKEGTGKNAVFLAKLLSKVARETQVKIIPVVQAADLKEIASAVGLQVWVQKVDAVDFGAHTGAIIPEAVLQDGAVGTFLNHSEAKLETFDELSKAVNRSKVVGLKTMVFAKDIEELKNICSLTPDFVAFEPPSLIGSTETSVVEAQTEDIKKAQEVSQLAQIPLIVGAGIHSKEDIKKSLELGAVGFAVATDIVKAQDPEKELLDLVEGFKK